MQLLLPRVAALAFLRSWSVVDTTLDVPRRFLRWRVQCNTGYSCLRLPARLWRWRRMTGRRLIGRFKAEHLEKPPTKSKTPKTPQKGQTAVVVGLPGALVCNRRLNQKRRGKATVAALSTRLWARDVAGRARRPSSTSSPSPSDWQLLSRARRCGSKAWAVHCAGRPAVAAQIGDRKKPALATPRARGEPAQAWLLSSAASSPAPSRRRSTPAPAS